MKIINKRVSSTQRKHKSENELITDYYKTLSSKSSKNSTKTDNPGYCRAPEIHITTLSNRRDKSNE